MWYSSFSVWLISLSIMLLRSIYVVTIWQGFLPFFGWITFHGMWLYECVYIYIYTHIYIHTHTHTHTHTYTHTQLNLQHGFELCKSMYMWIFLSSKYYIILNPLDSQMWNHHPFIWRKLKYQGPAVNYTQVFHWWTGCCL